jgi:hypothetical protein
VTPQGVVAALRASRWEKLERLDLRANAISLERLRARLPRHFGEGVLLLD